MASARKIIAPNSSSAPPISVDRRRLRRSTARQFGAVIRPLGTVARVAMVFP
jgi:hypothetical protein